MRYLIGLLVTIGLLIMLIVIIVNQDGGQSKVPATKKSLQSYSATNAAARYTIDGPINANQNHQQVQITVDRDNVEIQTKTGYDGQVSNMRSYANTEASYNSFLHALDKAGFTLGDTSKALKNEKGYCPLGSRYVFEFIQDGKNLERSWATSCGKPKSYLGATNLTRTLFRNQVPDYNKIFEDFSVSL